MKLSRWGVVATLVLVIVFAMIVDLNPSVLSSGHASAAKPGAQTTTLPSAARDGSAGQPFDYFPDHFINQAKEPAEPIATF